MYSKVLLLLCCLVANFLTAQNTLDTFTIAENNIVLLKNQKKWIPLQHLESIKVASLSFGMPVDNEFQQTLEKYTIVKPVFFDEKNLRNLHQLMSDQNAFDIVVLGLDLDNEKTKTPESIALISQLILVPSVITVVFGSENQLDNFSVKFKNASHFIFVPSSNKWSQSIAAQIVFGGFGAKGKMKKDVGGFKIGEGIVSKGNLRLRYAPPEFVNINEDLLKTKIQKIVQEGLDSNAYPGAQVLIAKDGCVVYNRTFGFHTYDQSRVVEKTDLYDFASLTKITGTLPVLMKLHGENQFDLDAPLKKYFPKFEKSNKSELTFRNILAHHARLESWIPFWKNTIKKNGKFKRKTFKKKPSKKYPIKLTDQLYLYKNYKEKQIYKAIKESPLNAESGYKYSGLAFYLFPEMISNITNEDFETYVKKIFYHRLGAYTLTYNPLLHFPKERIVPTELDNFFRKIQIHGQVHDEGAAMMNGVSGNAGLFGTTNDLAKLMQLYLNKGTYGGELFINPQNVAEFTKCQYCEEGNRRGLGFDKPIIDYDSLKASTAKSASPATFGHSGYTGTLTWVDPEENLIFIFFSNRVYPTRENRKIYTLNIRPRIHQAIYDSMEKK